MKDRLKIKPIAIILVLVFMFEYISMLVPFLYSIAETIYYSEQIGDTYLNWSYEIDKNDNAINLKLTNAYNIIGEVNIPNNIQGHIVISLGNKAFSGGSKITQITIPNGVTSIESRAFEDCSSLTEIIIPNSVTSIGSNAFSWCTSLLGITIPDSVTSIESSAFEGCSSLTEITIPNGVTSIGSNAFGWCTSLLGITIPDSVTSIESSAFAGCSSLTEITIPNGVTSIESRAFEDCSSLTEIIIPNSVTSIKDYAFSYCTNLTKVEIPDSVTSIGSGTFRRCASLTEIIIPNSVTCIEDYAFGYCTNLTKVEIPNSVESINKEAFCYCKSLQTITIPSSVVNIANGAFFGCNNLQPIIFEEGENDVTIARQAFAKSTSASNTDVYIPNNVKNIGSSNFLKGYTIYCNPNSVAEEYAKTNSIAYKSMITFNDQNLYEKIKVELQGYISEYNDETNLICLNDEDIQEITELDISNSEISDLTGIGNFTKLKKLNISNNNLDNFNDTNIVLPELEELDLSYNNIDEITINNLANLNKLNLSNNKIDNITDLKSTVTTIKELDLSYNQIKSTYDFCLNSVMKTYEILNLSNNKIDTVFGLDYLKNLKVVNLDNNFITYSIVTIERLVENNIESISLRNQKVNFSVYDKNQKIYGSMELATDEKYSNNEEVTLEAYNCIIDGQFITCDDSINGDDIFATVTVHGGLFDGTIYTLNPADDVKVIYEKNESILNTKVVMTWSDGVEVESAYIKYSIDDGELMEYEDKVELIDGIHKYTYKLFDKIISEYNIEFDLDMQVIRKNGKLYFFSNSDSDKYYSFEENEEYIKYSGPIEDKNSKYIYIKIKTNDAIQVEINNITNMEESEYKIYDQKIGANNVSKASFNSPEIKEPIYRENGKIHMNGNYFIFDTNANYRDDWKPIKTNSDELAEVHGIIKEKNNDYIFGQTRNAEISEGLNDKNEVVFTEKNKIDIDNKISKLDIKMTSITQCFGIGLMLDEDGNIYKIRGSNIEKIFENTPLKQISGKFGLDNENNIYEFKYNENQLEYEKVNKYKIDGKIEKLLYKAWDSDMDPYVLYENGTAEILWQYDIPIIISNKAIDIAMSNRDYGEKSESIKKDCYFVLELEKIKIYTNRGNIYTKDLSEILQDGEKAIAINGYGDILTNENNLYYNIGCGVQNLNFMKYSSDAKQTNVKRLGNNSYQDNNNNVFYINRDFFGTKSTTNIVKTQLETSDILITKNEEELNNNKVTIVLENRGNEQYEVEFPDGTKEKLSNEDGNVKYYNVTKNGVYGFIIRNNDKYEGTKVIHVTNIQNRKATKVPEVSAIDGKIVLSSDYPIKYSIDDKLTWNEYNEEIKYNNPIYAKVEAEDYECSIIKISINEKERLEITTEEQRTIQGEILTDAIGNTGYEDKNYNDNSKTLKVIEEFAMPQNEEVNTEKSFFGYISDIATNIVYSLSKIDGKHAGCNNYNNGGKSNITYRDINNDIVTIERDISLKNGLYNRNINVDYAVIKNNYALVEAAQIANIQNLTDEEIDNLNVEEINSDNDIIQIMKQQKNYAYIDSNGYLGGDIEILNKVAEILKSNTKFTKIVGDGENFFVLSQDGDVYLCNVYGGIEKIAGNIVDIYDSATARTIEGKIISLENDKEDSIVQQIQEQTDKYLIATHLGLKDGKLYDFSDFRNGKEVKKGKIVQSLEPNNSIGIYSKNNSEIKYFNRNKYYEVDFPSLGENDIYINATEIEGELPEFVDIAEYIDTYLGCYNRLIKRDDGDDVLMNYYEADKYTKCIAITKEGEIYAYINGYAVDTGLNLDYFGPTANYSIDNTKWTNENINAVITGNTKNEIVESKIEKLNLNNNRMLLARGANIGLLNNELEISSNGIYNYSVTDMYGRLYTSQFKIENIDKLKPNKPEFETEDGKLHIIFKDDQEATSDYGKSGINKRFISYDGENWEEVDTSRLTKIESAEEYKLILDSIKEDMIIYAKTVDNAGNQSDVSNGKLTVNDPTDPTDPEDPTNPTDPTEPEDPTDPTNPTDPEDPTDPTEPEDPTDPEDPTNPTDPTEPEDPTDPTNPTDPEDPTDPTDPEDPTDPTDPENPADPEKPVEDPRDPVESSTEQEEKPINQIDKSKDNTTTDESNNQINYNLNEKEKLPQTGQSRIVYISFGVIIVLAVGILVYIKIKESKKDK